MFWLNCLNCTFVFSWTMLNHFIPEDVSFVIRVLLSAIWFPTHRQELINNETLFYLEHWVTWREILFVIVGNELVRYVMFLFVFVGRRFVEVDTEKTVYAKHRFKKCCKLKPATYVRSYARMGRHIQCHSHDPNQSQSRSDHPERCPHHPIKPLISSLFLETIILRSVEGPATFLILPRRKNVTCRCTSVRNWKITHRSVTRSKRLIGTHRHRLVLRLKNGRTWPPGDILATHDRLHDWKQKISLLSLRKPDVFTQTRNGAAMVEKVTSQHSQTFQGGGLLNTRVVPNSRSEQSLQMVQRWKVTVGASALLGMYLATCWNRL